MEWIEITVRTNTAGADMVSERLMAAGAKGTYIEDRNDAKIDLESPGRWDVLDPEVIEAMSEEVLVRAYLPEDAAVRERVLGIEQALAAWTPELLGFDAGSLTLSIGNVRDEDWAENWKKYYKPFRVGKRLLVKPVWETIPDDPDALIIEIDPGMAFGNGTHETTALCMAMIEERLQPGDAVLDVGTGSGILAIAAARLGAGAVLAVDLDPVAVRVAKENIERNGLSELITAQEGDLLAGVQMQANVVVANIIADAIILLSGAVKQHIVPGGAFIASGIIREREQDVRDAMTAAGFTIEAVAHKGEWVALAARA
ncbi:MAG: 50S ribosomal protein L11 methyltransferase [Oscillospiraceae bacterium]|jgi:ribosomal protein L11 methyltransferase|nr:50S ribosomal protein L11 methyltransferase [Oscillospiraceae bacterium]